MEKILIITGFVILANTAGMADLNDITNIQALIYGCAAYSCIYYGLHLRGKRRSRTKKRGINHEQFNKRMFSR